MKKALFTKVLSLLLATVMVILTIPAAAIPVFAKGVPEKLVDSLTDLYDGDEARARKDLEALYAAGLIDDKGKMVELDVREDGTSVELSTLANRILNGEDVGKITVNSKSVTADKIIQLQQVNSMLEVIRLIDTDVKITDEHVANLQK